MILRFRKSHRATVLSEEAVNRTNSALGLKDREFTGCGCALMLWTGLVALAERMSWIWRVRSSETDANRESWRGWKETSFTTASCVV